MSQSKPSIVLIPGAWHTPAHYEELIALLENAGYPVKSMQLPSAGSTDPESHSVATDAEAIRQKLLYPLLEEEGKDVVVLMHSYGGCPGAAAVKGVDKTKINGKIIGIVFLAAFLAREGDSLRGALGGKLDPWVIINEETGQTDVENPTQIFYQDVPSDKASAAVSKLQLQSHASLIAPSPPSAWGDSEYDGRRAYIRALDDHTIAPIAQEMMVKYSGVDWILREMNTGHSPFLSNPQGTADIILEIISAF